MKIVNYPHGYGACPRCGAEAGRFCVDNRWLNGLPVPTPANMPHSVREHRQYDTPRMGMTAWLYVNAHWGPVTSNGGISAQGHHQVLVVGDNVSQITQEHEGVPVVYLTETTPGYIVAQPAEGHDPTKIGWMAGGSFIHTDDSRWFDVTGTRLPIPLHDRQESVHDYEVLTR